MGDPLPSGAASSPGRGAVPPLGFSRTCQCVEVGDKLQAAHLNPLAELPAGEGTARVAVLCSGVLYSGPAFAYFLVSVPSSMLHLPPLHWLYGS